MKILGIDYGEKRIGLAISDESQTLARELEIVSPKKFWDNIKKLIVDESISKIVVGWPLNMDCGTTKKTEEVRQFIEQLGNLTDLRVEKVDERLSSVMAGKIAGSQKNIDSLAAQIILQTYLNRQKSQN